MLVFPIGKKILERPLVEFSELEKFQQVDSALSCLALGKKGMCPTDPGGYFPLRQPRFRSSINKPLHDTVVDILQPRSVCPFGAAGFGLKALPHTPSLGVFW
jgi:hypothetical protein